MSRVAVLLSLFIALTGTPLRQAEAAADLVRSLAEVFEPANLESPDGGVGDDAGEATLNGLEANLAFPPLPSIDHFVPPPALVASQFDPNQIASLRERVWQPSRPPNLRHAWLQNFLF
jgi:hypothetical protein